MFDHSAEHKKSSDIIPAPVPLDTFKDEFRHKLTILNRITIIYSEPVIAHAMVSDLLSNNLCCIILLQLSVYQNNSTNLKKYDLVAGAPLSDAAFHHCCSTFSGDIVARHFNENSSTRLNITHKYYQLALRRGMCFELKYGPAIIDSNLRKEILSIAHTYASQRKAKNVIISSGALTKFQVRGPYDIANLYPFYETFDGVIESLVYLSKFSITLN